MQVLAVSSKRLTIDKRQDFSKLWARAYPAVGSYVASLVQDYHAVEDIMGRTSETLISKMDQYDGERPFEFWAVGIARYEILRYRREKARDRLLFGEDILEKIGDKCCEMSREMSSRQWGLQQCLKKISGRAAKALDLRYGDDLRYEAIGNLLGMQTGAVRSMLHRTRETLRQCIDRHMAADG